MRLTGISALCGNECPQEEKDSVKNMNQMMLYSKCVTIRDAQIQEKKQMMLETEDETRRQVRNLKSTGVTVCVYVLWTGASFSCKSCEQVPNAVS